MSARDRKRRVLRAALASMAFDVVAAGLAVLLLGGLLYGASRVVTALDHAFPCATSATLGVGIVLLVVGIVIWLIVTACLGLRNWYRDALSEARSYVDD